MTRKSLTPTSLLMVVLFGLFAEAKIPAPQATAACLKPGARILLNLELTEDERARGLANPSAEWRLPTEHCLRAGQFLSLSRRNAKNASIVWGRARLTHIAETATETRVRAEVTPLLLERTLAPEGRGLAEVVLQLPSSGVPHHRIDLRADEGPRLEIPDARAIPFTDTATFAFEKLPPNGLPLILIVESPDLRHAGLFDLLRELRLRGYANLYWYYPGAQGFKNFYALFPAEAAPTKTCGEWVLTADEAALFERDEMLVVPRALPASCLTGDSLRLVRFEKPAETAFVIGLVRALRAEGQRTLVHRLWFDPRETGWIAWIGGNPILEIDTQPAPNEAVRLRRPEDVAQLLSPEALKNPNLHVEIAAASTAWRGVLEALREKRRSLALRVHAPLPRLSFESIPGVIDIAPERHRDLRISGAIVFRPPSLIWPQGPSLVRGPLLRAGTLREKLAALREARPESDALVILSEGIHDTEAPKLARELLGLGYRRIYWDRGASLPAPRKFRFDPAPATH